jgi:hypothetical protein
MKMLQTYMQSSIMNAQETTNMEKTSVFAVLNKINCNEHTEKKNGLTYLSWAWAWQIVKGNFPDAYYTIYEDKEGIPYFTDGKTCWVKTGVTIQGLEHIEYLPIMDFRNQAIPLERVTSTDMNKAIQRSLTKACARHGLGLYIYAGEDLPEGEEQPVQNQPSAAVQARRQAAGRGRQQPTKIPYTPVDQGVFNRMIENYAHGIPAKTGEDYRTAWINYTHAGEQEIIMFDQAVIAYKQAVGINL